MKNFWKSQWPILVVGFIWLTAAIIYAILGHDLQSALFFVAAWVTFLVARISHLEKRIKEQEAHQKALAKLVEAVKDFSETAQVHTQLKFTLLETKLKGIALDQNNKEKKDV